MIDKASINFIGVVTYYRPDGTGYLRFDARGGRAYEISSDGISTSVSREMWIDKLNKAMKEHA